MKTTPSTPVHDCYIGRMSCGCAVAWVNDDGKNRLHVAKSIAEFIKRGYAVEPANTDEIRSQLGRCKCEPKK